MTTTAIAAESVVRIPARMERLPLTRYIWFIAMLAAMAWFVESIDIGAMGVVLPALQKLWALAPSQVGLLAVASTIGIVVGLVPAGRIADRLGRKTLLVWGVVIYSSFTILAAFSNGLGMLIALRFLSGLGMGAAIPLPYAIICEFVGRGHRTFFNGFVDAALSVGYFGAPLLGFAVFRFWHPEVAWRIFFLVAGLPLVYAYFVGRYMPESPRWLARSGRGAEADRVMTNIERIVEQQSGRPLGPVDEAVVLAASRTHGATTVVWYAPWTPLFLSRTIVSMICAVGAFFMFYIVMIFFPTIFHDRGLHIANSLLFTAIITGAAIPGKLLNGWLAERYGRKAMYLVFMGLAGVGCLFFLSALGSTTAMLAYACVMSFFGTGAFPALKIWYAEQYPTPVRGTGASTVEMVARLLGGVVGAYMFPVTVANQGLGTAFYAVAGVTFFGVAIMAIFGHETRGKTLEHLEQELIEPEATVAAPSTRPV
jgi:MFS transporter, putative metabolite:H+ symporter